MELSTSISYDYQQKKGLKRATKYLKIIEIYFF